MAGGQNSISTNVKKSLENIDEDNVQRLWGDNSYETSAKVAKEIARLIGGVDKAIIASGEVFADALSAAPLACKEKAPILFISKHTMPEVIKKTVKDLNIDSFYIAGGFNTVAQTAEGRLGHVIKRFDGRNRYETAIMIAEYAYKSADQAFIALGQVFSDALVIGPVAGKEEAPILLSSQETSKETDGYLEESIIDELVIVGGENTISNKAVNDYKTR